MATVIRFSRHGTKKKPYYRIVVQHNRAPRDGRFIEHIGAYNPIKGSETVTIKRDRLEYWLSTGAQMSDSVKSCLKPTMVQWKTGEKMAETKDKSAPTPAAAPKKAPAKQKEAPSKA